MSHISRSIRLLGVATVSAGSNSTYCDWNIWFPWRSQREKDITTIVDCGSGHTTAITYGLEGPDQKVVLCSKKTNIPVITAVLCKKNGDSMKSFLDAVAVAAGRSPDVSSRREVDVIIGMTGGVRHALKTKKIPKKMLSAFVELSIAPLPEGYGYCDVAVLSGEEEAILELRATRHVMKDPKVGMLSGGGKSMQIGFGNIGESTGVSIALDSLDVGPALMNAQGYDMGARMWEWRSRQATANALMGKKIDGHFIGIEMCAWIFKVAGVPTTVAQDGAAGGATCSWTRDEIIGHLGTFIENVTRKETGKPIDRDLVLKVLYATQLRSVLTVGFSKNSTFSYFEGLPLEPDWTLGMFLAHLQRKRKRENAAPLR